MLRKIKEIQISDEAKIKNRSNFEKLGIYVCVLVI